jgi:tetratricopeptide (TPR) repeat protein
MSDPGAISPKRSAIVIALLMATVSIVSAVVANRAAYWSSTAGDMGGQALQELLEAQQIEDDLRTLVDADVRLAGRYDVAWQRSAQLQTQAAALRGTDPTTATSLDIEAQGEYGLSGALWRYFRAMFPAFDAEGELLFDPDAALLAYRAGDVRLTELARSDARAAAGEARDRTSALVAIAAAFVASLFLLTIAQVTSGRRRLVALGAGVGLAAIATTLAVLTDLNAGLLILATVLAAAAVITVIAGGPQLIARRRARAATGGAASAVAGDEDGTGSAAVEVLPADPPTGQPSGRFAGFVGVTLAAATLMGAIVGYYQGVASDAGNAAAGEARDQALRALTEHQAKNQWATSQVEQWTRVLEERARAVTARQAAAYWSTHGEDALAALATSEAEQRLGLAERAARLTELSTGHPDGPEADPDFPLRFFAAQGEQTARRVALQDLANEANAHYGALSAGHVAVIATIAIAAYLLGLSLVLDDRRSQRLFAVVGTGLLVVSAGWAAWNELGTPPRPDAERREAIATAYGRAEVGAATARTPAQWQVAADAYRAVLELHPSLARARVALAGAIFMAASPQIGSGFTSVSSIDAVRAAATELEVARAQGWQNVNTLGDGGFYETLLALEEPASGHADEAVALTAAALERAEELPVVHFNHGAALLVAGRLDEARAAYQRAIDVSLATAPDGTPISSPTQRWRVAAGALTDLAILGSELGGDPVIGPAIEETRTFIVAGLGDQVSATDPAIQPVVSDLAVHSTASQLWWTARIDAIDSERDTVAVVWSYEDPVVSGQHVLDIMSGPLRLGSVSEAGSFYVDVEEPRYWSGRSYLQASTPQRCVPDGTYQVELFINGQPATAPVIAIVDHPELVTVSRRDMGVLFCRPADWVPGEHVDGSRVTFTSPDGTMGLTVARVFRPNAVDDGQQVQSLQVMSELMAQESGSPVASGEPIPEYFMGLLDAHVQWFQTDTGWIKVRTGTDSLGTVFVAAIHGPSDWVDGSLASGILESFSTQ